ncbi:hypothetical protein R6Q59_019460 [Mikania micrantha]
MGARIPAHQLSNGLYISVRPNQNTQPHPTIGSGTIPSTDGDANDFGKTGKVISEHRNYDSDPISKLSSGSGPIAAFRPTGSGGCVDGVELYWNLEDDLRAVCDVRSDDVNVSGVGDGFDRASGFDGGAEETDNSGGHCSDFDADDDGDIVEFCLEGGVVELITKTVKILESST